MSATAPVFEPQGHIYTLNGKPLVSVNRVIDAVMKKSWSDLPPERMWMVKDAAERGQRTEDYNTEILETGSVTIPAGERQDVIERVEIFWKWYSHHKPILMQKQVMVWSETAGVAGKLDWVLFFDTGKHWLVDCKCTSQAEKGWALQLGAYAEYYGGHIDACAVLHINPAFAQGYIWREYSRDVVIEQWYSALNWYKTLQQLNAL